MKKFKETRVPKNGENRKKIFENPRFVTRIYK